MPLSKCRWCGKKVPNPYRPYHEQVACRVMRFKKGLLFDMTVLPRVIVHEQPTDEKQKTVEQYLELSSRT